MTTDTSSSFVGTRLTEAREAMRISVAELAKAIGVSRTIVYEWEKGTKQPGTDAFAQICHVLEQPPRFFADAEVADEYDRSSTHFRARMATRVDEQDMAGVRLKWIIEYFSRIQALLSLPDPDYPDFGFTSDPTLITQQQIEETAEELRQHWGLGDSPIPHLIRVLERKGGVVGRMSLGVPNLDGLSFWSTSHQRPFFLLNGDKASCVRSRFDAAHELAHMILHRRVVEGERGSDLFRLMEQQAHDFAGAFLLPRSSWFRETRHYTLGEFKALKLKWKVSISAQVMRAALLDEGAAERKSTLMKQLSSKRWRIQEPYDDLWPAERPKLLEQATKLLAEHGYGASTIVQQFPRRSEHLSQITGLDRSFFEVDALPIQMNSSLN